jgi:hypothetical protein
MGRQLRAAHDDVERSSRVETNPAMVCAAGAVSIM